MHTLIIVIIFFYGWLAEMDLTTAQDLISFNFWHLYTSAKYLEQVWLFFSSLSFILWYFCVNCSDLCGGDFIRSCWWNSSSSGGQPFLGSLISRPLSVLLSFYFCFHNWIIDFLATWDNNSSHLLCPGLFFYSPIGNEFFSSPSKNFNFSSFFFQAIATSTSLVWIAIDRLGIRNPENEEVDLISTIQSLHHPLPPSFQ